MNERINMFIKHLDISVSMFEKNCGLSNGAVSKIGFGTRHSTLDKISKVYPQLNIPWLLTGEGEMLNDTALQSKEQEAESAGNIRYWEDVSATGGCMEFLENPDEHEVKMISVPRFADCTDAVNIYGDSMYPVYKSGEIILIKPWKESFIDYGCCYLIVTKNGNRMVKYLRRSEHSDKVLCVSENKQFDPFEIDRSEILRLFLVRGSIKADTI